MARPRLPTELLELRGTFRKNPNRRRSVGAKSDRPIGEPPDCLNEVEAAAWREMVETSVPGLLTSADRVILEMTCRLLGRFRGGQIKGSEMRTLLSCLTHLGRTPAKRGTIAA